MTTVWEVVSFTIPLQLEIPTKLWHRIWKRWWWECDIFTNSCWFKNICWNNQNKYKGYFHYLFCCARRVKGIKATYQELADEMNVKSSSPSDPRPTLSLHRLQLFRWFHENHGKEISPKEKPLDTPELIEKNKWVRKYFDLLTDKNKGIAYIDKKMVLRYQPSPQSKEVTIGSAQKRRWWCHWNSKNKILPFPNQVDVHGCCWKT